MNPSTSHPVFSWLLGRRRDKPALPQAGAAAAAPTAQPSASSSSPRERPHEADASARTPARAAASNDPARRRLLAALYTADVQRALLDALPVPVLVTLLADHTLLHANVPARRWLDGCDAAQGDLWARVLDAPARDWFLTRASSADGVDGLAVHWHGADGGRGASPLRLSARRIDFGGRAALLTTLLGGAEPPPATGSDAPGHDDRELRRALRAALPGAVARGGELRLRCQPRIDGRSGRAASVEACVEWLHPEHGLLAAERWAVSPDDASAAATAPADAAAAPVPALDAAFDWALGECCALWRRWCNDGGGAAAAAIALRVPPSQPLDLPFAAAVAARLASAGVAAGAIELELAEPALARHAEHVPAALQQLKAAGLTLSVGCFGTGRSSLETLQGLPIDALRIDASLVQALADGHGGDDGAADDPATRIVRAIVELGRALGRKVGGHGVAHPAEEAALLRAGCDELQGPLYGEPMTPDACAAWLRGHGDLRTGAVLIDD